MKRYKAGEFAQHYQASMMKKIARMSGGKDHLLKWLQENLGMGRASAYRRLNGETLFDLEEIVMIISAFKIPVTELFESDKSILYFYQNEKHPSSYEEWFASLDKDFSKLILQPNCKMYYSSTESPVFYYFHFNEFTHFKLYIWAKTIWQFEDLKDVPFSFKNELWNEKVVSMKEKFLEHYTQIPSIEFWTPNFLSNNLNQIQYFLEGYLFENREDALLLCQQLREMLKILQEQTLQGHKKPIKNVGKPGSYELYYNEILHTNNTIFFTSDSSKALYTTFGNPNTIKTYQKEACDYTEEWFEKLRRSSHKINPESERDSTRLFKRMEDKINKAELLFQGLI